MRVGRRMPVPTLEELRQCLQRQIMLQGSNGSSGECGGRVARLKGSSSETCEPAPLAAPACLGRRRGSEANMGTQKPCARTCLDDARDNLTLAAAFQDLTWTR